MGFLDNLFNTKIDYSDDTPSPPAGWPAGTPTGSKSSTSCPLPMHQEFAASSPALSADAPRATSAAISIPVPPNAKSYRVVFGVPQIDQGVPAPIATATRSRRSSSSGEGHDEAALVPTPDPLAAFGAVALGTLEPSSGDIGTTEIQLAQGVIVPITVPQKSLRVTVVWGLVQPTSLPAGALKVPVFVDFT